ncbi:GNAT family N-acetyltransferase [Sporolactobacillus shoreicorticis]|uniref:GNAT family N-acetyltransferase n=1 Tax=Sporolactobacillus shoreicorticis TaxID=1923877 RepID=A0ABW5RX79_9BACL|nr:GNAT family N-acetyltransferase [Sporolactobacillus shoreicorticis]MCO7124910.1 GNAT family N-acetyltransferase [Sporolactobacillus shoreicorticis]
MSILITDMLEEDFAPYLDNSTKEYAKEKQQSGAWPAERALMNARAEISRLLPQGYRTANHRFLSLVDETGRKVGIFWLQLSPERREAFIYDFEIFEPYRGHGLGQLAMQTLFVYCRTLGLIKISLHVFAHNTRAYHVYQKLGYQATDINMSKWL